MHKDGMYNSNNIHCGRIRWKEIFFIYKTCSWYSKPFNVGMCGLLDMASTRIIQIRLNTSYRNFISTKCPHSCIQLRIILDDFLQKPPTMIHKVISLILMQHPYSISALLTQWSYMTTNQEFRGSILGTSILRIFLSILDLKGCPLNLVRTTGRCLIGEWRTLHW